MSQPTEEINPLLVAEIRDILMVAEGADWKHMDTLYALCDRAGVDVERLPRRLVLPIYDELPPADF